jgi:hypothetical protein
MKRFSYLAVALCAMVMFVASAQAALIEIHFTDMDLVYDGSAIYDAGSTAGGLANPADADPLASVDFFGDGVLIGSLSSDIWLDVFIPDINGISAAPNTSDVQTTPGSPGFFDLLIGTSPLASEFLLVDLASVTFAYADALGVVQFTFGGAVSDVFAQNLPFDLMIDDAITVSFSARVVPGTLTDNGTDITGFTTSGTGEYTGEGDVIIPEPATMALLGIGGLIALRRRAA